MDAKFVPGPAGDALSDIDTVELKPYSEGRAGAWEMFKDCLNAKEGIRNKLSFLFKSVVGLDLLAMILLPPEVQGEMDRTLRSVEEIVASMDCEYSSVEGADKLLVVLPAWNSTKYATTIREGNERGYNVLAIGSLPEMLSTDIGLTNEVILRLADKIIELMRKKTDASEASLRIAVHGTSLGSALSTMIANRLQIEEVNGFRQVVPLKLVTPGANLGDGIRESMRTAHFARRLREEGHDRDSLSKALRGVSPEANCSALKSVAIDISLTDGFVMTEHGEAIADTMINNGTEVTVRYSYVGHVLTAAYNWLKGIENDYDWFDEKLEYNLRATMQPITGRRLLALESCTGWHGFTPGDTNSMSGLSRAA